MRAEVVQQLKAAQEAGYRDFHRKTCPGAGKLLGVRMPVQRKLARQIVAGDFRQFLAEAQEEFYEEIMIEGLVIATAPLELEERLKLLRKFVPKIQNWAICDAVCASLKIHDDELDRYWQFLTEFLASQAEFERRFAIVVMLNRFLTTDYLTQILELLESLETDQYYVRMAIAWLIAEAMTVDRNSVINFLQRDQLSRFTHNKAIQKIRESYRMTTADKELVRRLRR